jgi:predicted TIM-barrel fold metal-dependent hydrolase
MTAVVDAHTHVMRSPSHGRELWSYFLNRSPGAGHAAEPPALHTVDEAEAYMDTTGVVHMNILMFTWSGRYWRDRASELPDDEPGRAVAAEELRRSIVATIRSNNAWALEVAARRPRFSTFVGVDPVLMTAAEVVDALESALAAGARGVKLVPFDCRITGDDPRLWPLYDWCAVNGVPLQSEVSGRPGAPGRPARFASALRAFPDLVLVFSHLGHDPVFGEGADREVAELAQEFPGVHTDLSLRLPEMLQGACTPEQFVALVRSIGTDRVLYGSNYGFVDTTNADPAHDPADGPQLTWARRSLEAFLALPLGEAERARIAGENFRRITGLPAG